MDLEDPVIRKFITNAVPSQKEHMANILELIEGSEQDREELYEVIEDSKG